MLKFLSPLAVLLLAGCASTQQAAIPPAGDSPLATAQTPPAPALQVSEVALPPADSAPPGGAAANPALLVTEVSPSAAAATPSSLPSIAAAPGLDPYQCMLSWAKGMQNAMSPWMMVTQRCHTHPSQP